MNKLTDLTLTALTGLALTSNAAEWKPVPGNPLANTNSPRPRHRAVTRSMNLILSLTNPDLKS